MRPVAKRITRAELAHVPEGMYVIAHEHAIMKQVNEYGREYEGPHVRVAHVKSGNTDISGLSQDTRRKLNICLREDGNLTLEAWCRADQIEIEDYELTPSRGGKYVCEACSKDIGAVVVSSKPVCPRCTSLCTVVSDAPGPVADPELKRLNQVIRMDRTIVATMKMRVQDSSLERTPND